MNLVNPPTKEPIMNAYVTINVGRLNFRRYADGAVLVRWIGNGSTGKSEPSHRQPTEVEIEQLNAHIKEGYQWSE